MKLGTDWVWIGLGIGAVYALYKFTNTGTKTADTVGSQATQVTGAAANLGTDIISSIQSLFDSMKANVGQLFSGSGSTTQNYNSYTTTYVPQEKLNATGNAVTNALNPATPLLKTSSGNISVNLKTGTGGIVPFIPTNTIIGATNITPIFSSNTGVSTQPKVFQSNVPSQNTISIFNKLTGETRVVPAVQGR